MFVDFIIVCESFISKFLSNSVKEKLNMTFAEVVLARLRLHAHIICTSTRCMYMYFPRKLVQLVKFSPNAKYEHLAKTLAMETLSDEYGSPKCSRVKALTRV